MRPLGIAAIAAARTASLSVVVISVSMKPGATALTVMSRLATSRASDLVSPMSPAFAAE